jgi:hypothetical protein
MSDLIRVTVGHGMSIHLAPRQYPGRTLCGRFWSDEQHPDSRVDCRGCRRAEGVDPAGLNKSQRASLTVKCPACGASRGRRCSDHRGLPFNSFAHVERFQKANKAGRTGRRGDPLFD